jgi:hypothetical protein
MWMCCGESLDGGPEGGSFRALHGDDWVAEDVGQHLTPDQE